MNIIPLVFSGALAAAPPAAPPSLRDALPLVAASQLSRAHHDGDLQGLRALAAPSLTVDWPALTAEFRRRLRWLLPTEQISCDPEPLPPGRSPQTLLRCQLQCRRGDYAAWLRFAHSDPPRLIELRLDDVIPAPRPRVAPALLAALCVLFSLPAAYFARPLLFRAGRGPRGSRARSRR